MLRPGHRYYDQYTSWLDDDLRADMKMVVSVQDGLREDAMILADTYRWLRLGCYREIASLFLDELLPLLKRRKRNIHHFAAPPRHIFMLVVLIKLGLVGKAIARKVLGIMCDNGTDTPVKIIADNGWKQINDPETIGWLVDGAIYEKPKAVADWKKGKKKAANVLCGIVMEWSSGTANPDVLNEVLEERLCAHSR